MKFQILEFQAMCIHDPNLTSKFVTCTSILLFLFVNLFTHSFVHRTDYYSPEHIVKGDVFLYRSFYYKEVIENTEAQVVVLCGVRSVLESYLRYWWILRSQYVEWLLVTERHLLVLGKYLPKNAHVAISKKNNISILDPNKIKFQNKYCLFCYDVSHIRTIPGYLGFLKNEIVEFLRDSVTNLRKFGSTFFLAMKELLTSCVHRKNSNNSYIPRGTQRFFKIDIDKGIVTFYDPLGGVRKKGSFLDLNCSDIYKQYVDHGLLKKLAKKNASANKEIVDLAVGLAADNSDSVLNVNKLVMDISEHFYSSEKLDQFEKMLNLNSGDEHSVFYQGFGQDSEQNIEDSISYAINEDLLEDKVKEQVALHMYRIAQNRLRYLEGESDDDIDEETGESDDDIDEETGESKEEEVEYKKNKKKKKKKHKKKDTKNRKKRRMEEIDGGENS